MAKSVTRREFLDRVAQRAGAHRRDVEHVWENAVATLQEAIKKGEAVSISGFGKFSQRVREAQKARRGINPFTKEETTFAARPRKVMPRFAPAKQFKDYVGGAIKSLPSVSTRPMALGQNATGGGKTAARGGKTSKTAAKTAAKGGSRGTAKGATRKAGAKKATRRR